MLVPIAAIIAVIIVLAFVWAIRSGQFEDMEGPAHRILMDDDDEMVPEESRPAAKPPSGDKP